MELCEEFLVVSYPAVDYRAEDQTFTVLFDPQTGLPARIRTLDYDNIWGDVTYDLVLSDWKMIDGIRVATSRKYELNGRTVADIKMPGTFDMKQPEGGALPPAVTNFR